MTKSKPKRTTTVEYNKRSYLRHAETRRADMKALYALNPEVHKNRVRDWKLRNIGGYLWQSIRRRKNVDPNLTRRDIENLVEPMICSVTGVKLRWDLDISRDPLGPSIDRINCSKGYSLENIRLTSLVYNQARSTYSNEELLEYLVKPMFKLLETENGSK